MEQGDKREPKTGIFFSIQTASVLQGKSEHELRPVLEGIFFYSCIWLELQVFAADNNSQVDGRVVQREAGGEVQRGLLRADGRRSLTDVQVFRVELPCCLLSDRSQTSTPIHLNPSQTLHCLNPSQRTTHGITVEVPGLRTAYALPVPKQRSVFSYQLVGLLHYDLEDSHYSHGCAR